MKKKSELVILLRRNIRLISLVLLASITMILGSIGFARQSTSNTFSENLYLTLQLFILQSGSGYSDLNWMLEIARFSGAFFSVMAAVQLLVSIFSTQAQLLKIRLTYRNHVIICGLGGIGPILAERYLSEGKKVVIIEIKIDNKFIQHLKEQNAIILIGDAANPNLLHKAGIAYAELVVAVCGNDGKNSEIVSQVAKIAREGFLNTQLEKFFLKIVHDKSRIQQHPDICCYAHILDPHLCHYLAGQAITSYTDTRFQVEFFNVFDSGARLMLQENMMNLSFTAEINPHIAIIGLNEVGQCMVLRAERACRAANRNHQPALTIIDPQATEKLELLECSCTTLENSFELNAYNEKIQNASFLNSWLSNANSGTKPLTQIYICLNDDSEALTLGLILKQKLRGKVVPIMVCLLGHGGLEEILVERKSSLASTQSTSQFTQLLAFDILECTCKTSINSQGLFEDLAIAVHENFRANKIKSGQSPVDNPNLRPWFAEMELPALSDDMKEQNRRQARRIGESLWKLGFGIEPAVSQEAEAFSFGESIGTIQERENLLHAAQKRVKGESDEEYYERLAELSKSLDRQLMVWQGKTIREDDLEYTARQEHESWLQSKLDAGYHWGNQKDETMKINPNALPWYDPRLSEDKARQVTREMIRYWPNLLASVDLRIYRR